MARGEFTKKSIGTLTLGEKLSHIRSEKRISLSEVAKSTRIQLKYLEYLENGEYDRLPADVYVKGFLRSYAYYLGMNEESFIKLYDREKNIRRVIKKEVPPKPFFKPINFSSFIITPRVLVISASAILVFFGFFYLYRQVNSFISTPRLVITEPMDNLTTNEKTVRVAGITEKDAQVLINDQSVLVNEEGKFSDAISLQPGVNTVVVKTKNRFEKETIKVISLKAEYETANTEEQNGTQNSTSEPAISELKLEVYVKPNPTWLSIEADGNLVFSGVLASEMIQTFTAGEKFTVTSGKGNNTYLKLNGKDKGVLSEDPGIVRDITFTKDNI